MRSADVRDLAVRFCEVRYGDRDDRERERLTIELSTAARTVANAK